MPVYVWQNLVYVAASSPGAYTGLNDWPENWILVEAAAGDLRSLWITYQGQLVDEIEAVIDPVEPSIQVQPTITPPNPSGAFSPDDLLANIAGHLEGAPQENSADEFELDDEESGEVSFGDEDSGKELSVDDAPPGLDLTELTSPTNLSSLRANPSSLRANPVSAQKPETPGTAPLPKPAPLAKTPPAPVSSAPASPPPLAPPLTPPPPPPKTATAQKSPPIAKNAGPGKSPHAEFEKLASHLNEIPSVYSTTLLATKAGNSMRVTYWPETLNSGPTEFDFSLGSPSPFRIVLRTEKSYHGYVVETPFLVQFFKHWNSGVQPETLTVVPIAQDLMVVGFIVGFGSADAYDRETLISIEQTAAKLASAWPKSSDAKAS